MKSKLASQLAEATRAAKELNAEAKAFFQSVRNKVEPDPFGVPVEVEWLTKLLPTAKGKVIDLSAVGNEKHAEVARHYDADSRQAIEAQKKVVMARRALADAGLLALIACLGLAQLSHETTPALAQLGCAALFYYGIGALPYHQWIPSLSIALGLVGMALSGAPAIAALWGAGAGIIHLMDHSREVDEARPVPRIRLEGMAILLITAIAATTAAVLNLWRWKVEFPQASWDQWSGFAQLLIWFTWPAWPLAVWTLWRWRRQWTSLHWSRHLVLPMWFTALTVSTAMLTHSSDQTLLLALPAFATLAAFALPTLRRSVAALIDWFTLLFFSGCAFIIWVIWIAMQTGWPSQPAANVARLAPGFVPSFHWLAFVMALAATIVWAWLVVWRTAKHRHALWKSLVLPAGGAALCWLLLLTLWLPLLDFARSYKPWVQQIQSIMATQDARETQNVCLLSYGLDVGQMTAFRYHGGFDVKVAETTPTEQQARCQWLLVDNDSRPDLVHVVRLNEWTRVRTIRRPSDNNEDVTLYHHRQAQ